MLSHHKQALSAFTRNAFLGACLANIACAWSAEPILPNAGTLLRESHQQTPAQKPPPALRLDTESSDIAPGGVAVLVNSWKVVGNTVFDSPQLLTLLEPERGKALTLREMEQAIARITALYQQNGYPLARAVLPAQEIDARAEVTVQVLEAQWGEMSFNNQSTVANTVLKRAVSGLKIGALVQRAGIDEATLLLADLPGIAPSASIRAGAEPGTSDVVFDVGAGKTEAGSIALDGNGSAYTGRKRLDLNYQILNPFSLGDQTSLSLLSTGENLNNLRFAYEIPVWRAGTVLGFSSSRLEYRLGGTAAALDASGSAQQTSVWLQKYLVRGFRTNVLARAQLDAMNLRDQVAASDTKTLRQMHKQNVEISGDSNVAWLGNANHNFAAALHFGQLGFDDAQAQAADSAAAKTEGKFSYVTLRLNRNQALSSAASLYLVWSGQWAGGNLDASQKFSLGGPNSVRAYESGAISGDNGQLATIELRYALPALAALPSLGQWQAVLFADYGQLKINQNPWSAASNEASLGGVGLGLNWQSPAGWRAKLSLATTTGDQPSQLANANAARSSAWVELRRDF